MTDNLLADLRYETPDDAPAVRSYEELCEAGRMARTEGDRANWIIGDLACEIETQYSEHTLADFAREIGKPKGTVYEARQMSGFWEPSERAEIEAEYPNVTRSHMRKCLPLKDIDLARFALDKCSARGWTVDQFGFILKRYRHMKGITPRPTKRDNLICAELFAEGIELVDLANLPTTFDSTKRYRVVIYEVYER